MTVALGSIPMRTCTVDLRRQRICRDGAEVRLSRLEAAVLRYLSERPHQDVPREELLFAVWGYPPTSTSRAIDYLVNRLRRKLGERDPPEHLLTAHGVGYRLVPLLVEPRPAPIVSQGRAPIRTAGGALDLDRLTFHGPDGAAKVSLSRLEGAILESLVACPRRTVPFEELARSVWGRGSHQRKLTTAIGRLRTKVERDPARPEVLVTVRRVGVRLESAAVVPRLCRSSLPPTDATFVETPDLRTVLDTIDAHSLVTLRGTGGIGKTRLALQAAAARLASDPQIEVWFCDLASVSEERGLAEVVAATIGLDPTGADLVIRLGRVLSSRPAGSVLVLDNVEQLVDCAPVISTWREAAPELLIWLTSRVALGIPEEVCIEVQPLAEDAAVQLFTDRSGCTAEADGPAIRALVGRLDGLPLAIELAAARARQLTVKGLLDRIGERLDLLIRPARGALSHHPTLRGAFDWSWELLGSEEQKALAALSVLVSAFDRPTARALVGPAADELLARLASHSLVQNEREGRWRLLEVLREYAGEKLVLMGARTEALTRRAARFLEQAEGLVATIDRERDGRSLRGLRALRDELLAVFQTAGDADTAARAALVLAVVEDRTPGAAPFLATLLDGAIAAGPATRHLWRLGWRRSVVWTQTGADERAAEALEEAHRLAEQDSPLAVAIVLRQLGLNRATLGQEAEALEILRDARERFLALDEGAWAARTLGNHAWIEARERGGDPAPALEQAIREARAAGDVQVLFRLLARHGEVLMFRGAYDAARERQREALAIAVARGDLPGELLTLGHLGCIDLEAGAFTRARRLHLEIERRHLEQGDAHSARVARANLGQLALELGRLDEARVLLEGPLPAFSNWHQRVHHAAHLAMCRLFQGEPAAARELLLGLGWKLNVERRPGTFGTCSLAIASASLGEVEEAERLLAELRTTDPRLFGVGRLLDLCDGFVDYARTHRADPSGADHRVEALLAAGELVATDEGGFERPQEVNLTRRLLVRFVEEARRRRTDPQQRTTNRSRPVSEAGSS